MKYKGDDDEENKRRIKAKRDMMKKDKEIQCNKKRERERKR